MFLASVGIFTARYYKDMWLQHQPCGLKLWFHVRPTDKQAYGNKNFNRKIVFADPQTSNVSSSIDNDCCNRHHIRQGRWLDSDTAGKESTSDHRNNRIHFGFNSGRRINW